MHIYTILQVRTLDFGMKTDNPIDEVKFFTKSNPNAAYVIEKDKVCLVFVHIDLSYSVLKTKKSYNYTVTLDFIT